MGNRGRIQGNKDKGIFVIFGEKFRNAVLHNVLSVWYLMIVCTYRKIATFNCKKVRKFHGVISNGLEAASEKLPGGRLCSFSRE